jgi:Rrf2 family protein
VPDFLNRAMPGIVKLSEAASIALHAMTLLASRADAHVTVRGLASRLPVSEAHLAKVMQRLVKAGLVASVRGPGGGFALRVDPTATTLLQIYEAIEGKLETPGCMFPTRPEACGVCIVDDALAEANRIVHARLARTRLAQLTTTFRPPSLVSIGRPRRGRPRGAPRA